MDSAETFTFTWKVEHYFCTSTLIEKVVSPIFKVQVIDGTQWKLHLLWRGNEDHKMYIGIQRLVFDGGPQTVLIDFRVILFFSDGSSPIELHESGISFSKGKYFPTAPEFECADCVWTYGAVTIECAMWKSTIRNDCPETRILNVLKNHWLVKNDPVIKKHECKSLEDHENQSEFNSSRVSGDICLEFEKRSLTYNIEDVSCLTNVYDVTIPFDSAKLGTPSCLLTLHLNEESNDVEVYIQVLENEIESFFVKCKIDVLGKNQDPLCVVKEGHIFESQKDKVWKTAPFNKALLLEDGGMYLEDDTLTLQIELTVFDNDSTKEIKERGFIKQSGIGNTSKTLEEELLKFFNEQTFCDVTLQTTNGTIQAHKLVICAKSPVFQEMLGNEVTKKITNIEIDIHTLKQMLSFMYSERFEGILSSNDVLKLYSTADKYRYEKLKKECSKYLMANISKNSVLKVLELAGLHQDKVLLLAAQVYIKSNVNEILLSDEWRNFIKDNISLATETLVYISKTFTKLEDKNG